MSRKIEGLKQARYAKSPWPAKRRARGAKAAGLRYEAKVREELARRGLDFCPGPWIEFEDRNGRGFAQPDFVIYDASRWLVLEAKLSQTKAAFAQLFGLYVPLLSFLHPDKELVPLQVCKYLKPPRAEIIEDLRDARHGAVWHWIG